MNKILDLKFCLCLLAFLTTAIFGFANDSNDSDEATKLIQSNDEISENSSAIKEEVPAEESSLDSGNTAWMITATALVLFMTLPGLALFYGGLVQSKNVLSVLMQCFAIACLASILWVVCGYSLSLTWRWRLVDWRYRCIFSKGIRFNNLNGDFPESVWVIFQMTFAIITPGLIVGAFVERIKFSAVLLFSGLWLIAVYFPVCYWVWGRRLACRKR